jgi:anti-sigma B factor antagonist
VEPFGAVASRTNGTAVVAVTGEVDLYTAPRLWDALDSAIAATPRQLIVDLSGVTFLDSSGLNVLVRAHKKLRPISGSVVVRGAGEQVYKALDLTKLNKVFTVEAARRA